MLKTIRTAKQGNVALGGTAAPIALRSLIAAFDSEDGTVRRAARESTVAIGSPAVRSLVKAMRYPSANVRWEAAKALGEIGDKTSAAALVLALEDKNLGVRWLAAEGLVGLRRHTLLPLLTALVRRSDSIWLREGALHILHQLAKQGFRKEARPVVAALEGPVPTVAVPLAARDDNEKLALSTPAS